MNPLVRLAGAAASSLAIGVALAACSSNSVSLQPQVVQQQPSAEQSAGDPQARPRFEVLRYRGKPQLHPSGGQIPLWNGSFNYNNHTYNYTMVGANPATSNTTTTIPVDIIPIKTVITESGKRYIFSATKKLPNGNTVVQNTFNSPIFQSGIDFVQGGTDLGNTQYIDAFQRGNFWSLVSTNTNYHTLLAPTVLPRQTIVDSSGRVGTEFGAHVGLVDISFFDRQIQGLIKTLGIPPTTFPIFLTYDVYLTSGGCCIGGYHSYNGTSTYAHATYIGKRGAFSENVAALSHEVGEWYDDPLTNNSACGGGLLEVGDPLEGGQPGHPYGTWAYQLNGFTYNLQDLVFLPYFGAPPSTSVNDWFTFQGYNIQVCG